MSNRPLNLARLMSFRQRLCAAIFSSIFLISNFGNQPAEAQVTEYCQLSTTATRTKENLRLSSLKGDKDAQNRYQQLLQKHAQELQECRSRTWPQIQALWLR